MKKLFLILFTTIGFHLCNAQLPKLEWAKQISGLQDNIAYDTKVDQSGNVYITGSFQNVTDFDPGQGIYNLTSSGYGDIYVLKLDPEGNFLWAKKFGGKMDDAGISLALDRGNSVYVTGRFLEEAIFDTSALLKSKFGNELFLLKLDMDGNFIWVKDLFGFTNVLIPFNSVTCDWKGNVYCIGSAVNKNEKEKDKYNQSVFILKLDWDGNERYRKEISGKCYARNIISDRKGNVYVSGSFGETVDFDPGDGKFQLTNPGLYDGYILKLDTIGNFLWVEQFTASREFLINSIGIDINENLFITGNFTDNIIYKTDSGEVLLKARGTSRKTDIFLLKMNNHGKVEWANQIGIDESDVARALTVDKNGNVYVTGFITGEYDFDPGPDINKIGNYGSNSLFVSKFDNNGNLKWAHAVGMRNENCGYGIAIDKTDEVLIVGQFKDIGDFDPGPDKFLLTSNPSYYANSFILKISQGMTRSKN